MMTFNRRRFIATLLLIAATTPGCGRFSLSGQPTPSPRPPASLSPKWTPSASFPEITSTPEESPTLQRTLTSWSNNTPPASATIPADEIILQPGPQILSPTVLQHEEFGTLGLGLPVFSPDGRWIAVTVGRSGDLSDVVIVESTCVEAPGACEGALLRAIEDLPLTSYLIDFSWSPDSDRIAAEYEGEPNVLKMIRPGEVRVAGEDEVLLPDGWFSSVRWSPAGDKLLWKEHEAIYSSNPDGSNWTLIRERVQSPFWSPDGSMIAMSETVSGYPGLWIVTDPQGRELIRLGKGYLGAGTEASWSPDGKRIALEFFYLGNPWLAPLGVFVATVDGSDLTDITIVFDELYSNNESPVWSPDGRYIALYSLEDCEIDACALGYEARDIFLIQVESMKLLRVTDDGNASPFGWSNDGHRLIYSPDELPDYYVWLDVKTLP